MRPRQSEEPKTGCQREPTAPLAPSSSVRRDLEHFARLRPLRRPSRPKQHRDFHQTERRLTSHRSGDIAQARKKGGLKFLYSGALLHRSFVARVLGLVGGAKSHRSVRAGRGVTLCRRFPSIGCHPRQKSLDDAVGGAGKIGEVDKRPGKSLWVPKRGCEVKI